MAPPDSPAAIQGGATVASTAEKCGSVTAAAAWADAERAAHSATAAGEGGVAPTPAAVSLRTTASSSPSIGPHPAPAHTSGTRIKATAIVAQQHAATARRRSPTFPPATSSASALPAAASCREPAAPSAAPPMANAAAVRWKEPWSSNRASMTSPAGDRRAHRIEDPLLQLLARRAPGALDGADVGLVLRGRPSDLLRARGRRSEEHTSELQSRLHLVCRLLLEKKKTPTR